jgi:hypothetical protein
MNLLSIELDIGSTYAAAKLGVQVWVDDLCIHQHSHVTENYHVQYEINDDEEKSHQLKIVMTGKTAVHTQLDADGNIVKDAMLSIRNIAVDGINIDKLVHRLATYQHDFNGTQPQCSDTFFGEMGCNGTVEVEFSTPIHIWMLEHM